jgi:hypothetical protein
MDELEQLITQLTVLRDQLVSGCEDHWILMVPSSIGELATVCALLPAFRAHHGGKICMVVDPGKRDVLKLFVDQIDTVKFVPLAAMRALSTYRVIDPLDFRMGVPQNLWINQNGDGRGFALHELFRSQHGRGGLSFIDLIRYAMNLPWEAPIVRGNIGLDVNVEAMRYAKVNKIEPGNSVILFTGNNTNKPASAKFWNQLSQVYADAGIKVFYNMHGGLFQPDGLDIQGTQIHLTTNLAVAICEIAGHMVSGSNGLVALGLLSNTTFKMDVILTDGYDPTGVGNFVPLNPSAGSHFLVMPELFTRITRSYREWEVIDPVEGLSALIASIVTEPSVDAVVV